MGTLGLILVALGVILVSILWKKMMVLLWRPYVLKKRFKEQGVSGPEYKFRSGSFVEVRRLEDEAREIELDVNSHDILPKVAPYYYKWANQYGGTFVYWVGPIPNLCVTDAEHVKQVLSNKFGFFAKPKVTGALLSLLGKGLVLTDGSEWARHRRVVSPAFTMDKLKVMTKQMAECAQSMIETWNIQMDSTNNEQKAIEVNKQFQELTADIISHSAFGSSYIEGKEVFTAQQELLMLTLASFNGSVSETKINKHKQRLDKKMRNTLLSIIENRMNSKDSLGYGNDLLGLMLESTEKQEGTGLNTDEIIDECKTFFFGGHETTSELLAWTTFLLSTNQEWQVKLRDEVVKECGREIPKADNLSKFKLMNMVLLEALRLYPPVPMIGRVAANDVKLGDIMVPKGTAVSIPFIVIHRKKELWGEDADKFNPLRFENGVTKAAKHPAAMLAFSVGPRACIGQNFAMLEAKTVMATILQRFSFTISPEYKHKPVTLLTLQPQDGLPIIFKPLVY
ncbi:cytochrome P450 709B1-like [Asparagus officinalis]|uniref:cytochrome P450 709B1-like n=1 Tax=Asparagus officinalis TaxID=4686 RepID=UPI00098E6FCC|nr:cytochrome P450 709B1-like [Asparagus officinalis]